MISNVKSSKLAKTPKTVTKDTLGFAGSFPWNIFAALRNIVHVESNTNSNIELFEKVVEAIAMKILS